MYYKIQNTIPDTNDQYTNMQKHTPKKTRQDNITVYN